MKIKVFAWLLLSDRLNTRNMLNRRHFLIGDDLKCVLCDAEVEETLDRLFLCRPFSFDCWLQIGIHWPLDATVWRFSLRLEQTLAAFYSLKFLL